MFTSQSIAAALREIFGGDSPGAHLELHQVAARAAIVFLFGLAIVRLGKNRMIGRITPLDMLLGIILGSLLSRGITGEASLSGTAVASITIVAMHWVFSWVTYRSHTLGNLIKGRATLVVKDGQPLQEKLAASHLSDHDLEAQLRLSGIADLREVKEAYEERSGELSFVRRPEAPRVVDIAVESGVQTVRVEIV